LPPGKRARTRQAAALKDSGEIDADTDVDATATAVLAAIQGGVLTTGSATDWLRLRDRAHQASYV
jgi:hypothetical protein